MRVKKTRQKNINDSDAVIEHGKENNFLQETESLDDFISLQINE